MKWSGSSETGSRCRNGCAVHSSLYIHLPFCRSKCRYCDFHSIAAHDELIDGYLDAVAREWELRTGDTPVELTSIYIGGGTPSLLSAAQWERFRSLLLGKLPLSANVEWTVECNPESFTEEKAHLLADTGVNRLTFGIQSMNDRELATAGRPHRSHEALETLESDVLNRFRSVGVDVIYGLPGQTPTSFSDTLHLLLGMPVVKHLSAYELTLAPETPFGKHRSLCRFRPKRHWRIWLTRWRPLLKGTGFDTTRYQISPVADMNAGITSGTGIMHPVSGSVVPHIPIGIRYVAGMWPTSPDTAGHLMREHCRWNGRRELHPP